MTEVTRPLLRWHGGKWRLAPWIIAHFPDHRIYVEPFGGAASVLLRKPPSFAEVYNDLDAEVVNLFEVLRSPDASRLVNLLRLTPWSRDEFAQSYEPAVDPVERARRLVCRCFMAFGTAGRRAAQTGFRAKAYRRNSTGCSDWVGFPDALVAVVDRLRGVVIENRDALEVCLQQDTPETLHYVDPPYVFDTRTASRGACNDRCYAHELDDAGHERLLSVLLELEGMVVLSGYPSALYDGILGAWRRVERHALADGAVKRTEVLWLNPAAAGALDRAAVQPSLIAEGAG